MAKNVVAMLLKPGMDAELISIEPTSKKIGELVGGMVDYTWPIDDTFCIAVNDVGKLEGLPLNRALRNSEGKIIDIYAGTMVILADHGEEEFDDLTPCEVANLMSRFGRAEYGWKAEDLIGSEKDSGEEGTEIIVGAISGPEDLMYLLKELFEG